VEELVRLHKKKRFMKPLLSSVQSTLYVYRRKKSSDKDDDPAIVRKSIMTNQGQVHQDRRLRRAT
jgi:hypothetical protein